MKIETIPDTVVSLPPAGVVAVSLWGIPLQTWVLWLNLLYIVIVIGWKVLGIYKETKNGKRK